MMDVCGEVEDIGVGDCGWIGDGEGFSWPLT